jgi:hypothetical protein
VVVIGMIILNKIIALLVVQVQMWQQHQMTNKYLLVHYRWILQKKH